MNSPISITRPKPYLLSLKWADGFEASILLEKMREECPCAACKGEEIMGQHFSFGIKMFLPGMNDLQALIPVGHYAVQAKWKDGHHTGIYTWSLLRQLAEKHQLSIEELADLSLKELKG